MPKNRKFRGRKRSHSAAQGSEKVCDKLFGIPLQGILIPLSGDAAWNPASFDFNELIREQILTQAPEITTHSIVCDSALLEKVNTEKAALTELWLSDRERFYQARARSNPYELISSARIFQNRAAFKLAELDSMFMPILSDVPLLPEEKDILIFADLCAGPGGFSEYLYWRRKWRCKGYAFTLKGICDMNVLQFHPSVPIETFEIEYGCCGDGDIYRKENIQSFRARILSVTKQRGVALVTADGGFSTEGDWYRQEFLTKRLILCQFLTALCILRPGGSFVCKMFDTFQDFTLELIYLVTLCFSDVHMTKPIQSRPANSERYLVCHNLVRVPQTLIDYLFVVNDMLGELGFHSAESKPIQDLKHILHIRSETFLQNMRLVVEKICQQQCSALCDIQRYYWDMELRPSCDQRLVRDRALKQWKIYRSAARRKDNTAAIFESLTDLDSLNRIHSMPEKLLRSEDWNSANAFVICQSEWRLGFLVSLPNAVQFHASDGLVEALENVKLPRGCVFVAEKMDDGIFGIIDVHTLCREIVTHADYHCRIQKAETVLALSEMSGSASLVQLHTKILFPKSEESLDHAVAVLQFPVRLQSCQKAINMYKKLTLPHEEEREDSSSLLQSVNNMCRVL